MVQASVITPNGLRYGWAYYNMYPRYIPVRPRINSFLCGYCNQGDHHLHAAVVIARRCECLLCTHKK